MEKIIQYLPAKLLLIGDLISVLSPKLDRPKPPKQHSADLYNWVQAIGVTEIWRWRNPEKRTYSCFSTSYKTASRIDLAFADPAMLADIAEAAYLPSGLADHSPLSLSIHIPTPRNASLWRLTPQWVLYPEIAEKITSIITEYWQSNAGSSSVDIVWDAFKAYLRGQYISNISVVNKKTG